MKKEASDIPVKAKKSFENVEKALAEIRQGKMVVVVDDDQRENEGDLVLAAQFATPENINFMAKHGRGLICLSMEEKMVQRLKLPLMAQNNEAPFETAFTVSIEAKSGVSTGISAQDRAHTIQTAIKDDSCRNDLVVPGHIFPLKAVNGGVLVRAGHTEASVDLSRLAGFKGAGVICEILNDDGTMARMPDLKIFAQEHDLVIVSIADLIEYRLHNDHTLVELVAESKLPTKFNKEFEIKVFRSQLDNVEHVALVLGGREEFSKSPALVRVHSECLTGDVFSSLRCDCGSQLDKALAQIAEAGKGVLLYLRQEGRGIGLLNKIKAYSLQDGGLDTVEANKALGFAADLRHYGIGAQILRSVGVNEMVILSNNPKKIVGIESYGLKVVGREEILGTINEENQNYLKTKKEKMGHIFE
jgi:3,4-dihydroxy 2-butanone 4-phosphate synthase/GTP cyclohydrolase II